METAAFVLSCIALIVALGSLGWQVTSWRLDRRFDVRAKIEPESIAVASGKYEISVVVTNFGATSEAIDEIWLQYSEHLEPAGGDLLLGPPSLRDHGVSGAELPPHRHVRRTYDLLGTRFGPFPSEVTAIIHLQSGKRVESAAHETDDYSHAVALGENVSPRPPTRD